MLATLRLEGNRLLRSEGLAAIAAGLDTKDGGGAPLQWLSLSGCDIDDVRPLAHAVGFYHLTHLFLESNRLEDNSAIALAKAIDRGCMTHGRRLWMTSNLLTLEGVHAIEHAAHKRGLHRHFASL